MKLFKIIFCFSTFFLINTLSPMSYVFGPTNMGEGAKNGGEGIKLIGEAVKDIATNGVVIKAALPQTAETLSRGVQGAAKEVSETLIGITKHVSEIAREIPQQVDRIITNALNNHTTKEFVEKGIQITLDKDTTQAIKELNETVKPIAQNGFRANIGVDPNMTQAVREMTEAVRPLAQNGVQISINPLTIKTFFTATSGFALIVLGTVILYKELTKAIDPQENTNKNWKHSFIKLLKSSYMIGSTSIIAGLVLIAQSNRIALLYP